MVKGSNSWDREEEKYLTDIFKTENKFTNQYKWIPPL